MQRIIMHWTAGKNTVSDIDRDHYHFIVDGAGAVHEGKHPVSDNESTSDGVYAAHTKACNTGSIGVAMAAMMGAKESPFSAGPCPITPVQYIEFTRLVARLARQYSIKVTHTTILTHAEVQPTLKIAQRGKWDITWLPTMARVDDPLKVGDRIRNDVKNAMAAHVPTKPLELLASDRFPPINPPEPAAKPAWAGILSTLFNLFRKGN